MMESCPRRSTFVWNSRLHVTSNKNMMRRIWRLGAVLRTFARNFLVSFTIPKRKLWQELSDQFCSLKLWEMEAVSEQKSNESMTAHREARLVKCLWFVCASWCGLSNSKKGMSSHKEHFCKICTWTIAFSCMDRLLDTIHKNSWAEQGCTASSGASTPMDGGKLDAIPGRNWNLCLDASSTSLRQTTGKAADCIQCIWPL